MATAEELQKIVDEEEKKDVQHQVNTEAEIEKTINAYWRVIALDVCKFCGGKGHRPKECGSLTRMDKAFGRKGMAARMVWGTIKGRYLVKRYRATLGKRLRHQAGNGEPMEAS